MSTRWHGEEHSIPWVTTPLFAFCGDARVIVAQVLVSEHSSYRNSIDPTSDLKLLSKLE